MTQIAQGLMTQISVGPEAMPLPVDDVIAEARDDAWVRTLLALTADDDLVQTWAESVDPGDPCWDEPGRLAWARADIDSVNQSIERALERANSGLSGDDEETRRAANILDALARLEFGWSGESIGALFPDSESAIDASVIALSMVAARGEPGALRAAVHETEVADDAIEYLRCASLAGASELWDQFLIWQSRLSDAELEGEADEYVDQLEGVGACLDPVLFARGLIGGDYDLEWTKESHLVADFLQRWGATDWLEIAGLLEHAGSEALETASVIAVSASRGIGEKAPGDDEIESLFELLSFDTTSGGDEPEDWEPIASELGLQFEIALGATVDSIDEGSAGSFGGLLAQIATHERLVFHGVHSPGVPGLPLSATSQKYIDLSAAKVAIEEMAATVTHTADPPDEEIVRSVRTLCDAATWYRRNAGDFESLVRHACDAFAGAPQDVVQLARGQLTTQLSGEAVDGPVEIDPEVAHALSNTGALATGAELSDGVIETLGDIANGESLAALDAIRRLGLGDGEASWRRLGQLWTDGPIRRATFTRQVLLESIRASN